MKKICSLILVLALCIGLCANLSGCSFMRTKLTLDNYEQYIDIRASAGYRNDIEGNSFVIGRSGRYDIVTSEYGNIIYGSISIEGKSQNFNYHDIEVEVEFTGSYNHCDINAKSDDIIYTFIWQPFTFTTTCDNEDITGKGYISEDKCTLPDGRGIPNVFSGVGYYYSKDDFFEYSYKIIRVSGSVSPA